MRQMRARIGHITIQAVDFSLALVPGLVVDLDKRLPAGGVLADLVDLAWFEPLEPAELGPPTRGARRRSSATTPEDDLTPASPAATEADHG